MLEVWPGVTFAATMFMILMLIVGVIITNPLVMFSGMGVLLLVIVIGFLLPEGD